MSQDQAVQLLSTVGLVGGLVGFVVFIIFIIAWWQIFSKAGYSGALSLLFLIPVVNLILFLWFAFSSWPVKQEVDRLRAGGARPPYQG